MDGIDGRDQIGRKNRLLFPAEDVRSSVEHGDKHLGHPMEPQAPGDLALQDIGFGVTSQVGAEPFRGLFKKQALGLGCQSQPAQAVAIKGPYQLSPPHLSEQIFFVGCATRKPGDL